MSSRSKQIMKTLNTWRGIISGQPHLTFEALLKGDKFIVFPHPGDNAGHGGFLDGGYLLMRMSDMPNVEPNSVRLCDGVDIMVPEFLPVIKIL